MKTNAIITPITMFVINPAFSYIPSLPGCDRLDVVLGSNDDSRLLITTSRVSIFSTNYIPPSSLLGHSPDHFISAACCFVYLIYNLNETNHPIIDIIM